MGAGVLDLVDWPGVLDSFLTDPIDEDLGEAIIWHARHTRQLPARHTALAIAGTLAGRHVLACIVREVSPDVDAVRVGNWLAAAAIAAHRYVGGPARTGTTVPAFTGPVFCDPRLPALDHLDLAARWAAANGRVLVVRPADLRPTVAGQANRRLSVTLVGGAESGRTMPGALIELSARHLDQAARVWRHELGHLFDPHPDRRTAAAEENYADAVGALLSACHPATLDQLAPLLDQAEPDRARPPVRTHQGSDLPAPTLAAFAALPV